MGPLKVACAAAMCLAAAGVSAAFARQGTVFRSGVDLISVDVSVVDGNGTPLTELTPDQFDVSVDGARRRVVWAEFVNHRTTPLEPAGAAEYFSTNEHIVPGRLILVAVDQAHIRRVEGLAALRAASTFIDSLEHDDRVAAAPLNHGGAIEFTTDHAKVKGQLQRLTGEASPMVAHFNIGLSEALEISDGSRTRLDQAVFRICGERLGRYENLRRLAESDGVRDPCPTQVEQESRAFAQQARTEARLSIDALGRLIVRLAEIEGPKTLVLVSEGLIAEPQLIDLTSLGAAAQAARVTIFVLQLEVPILDASTDVVSPTLFTDAQLRSDGLARLSGSARGALFRLVGADPYPFQRILRELSGHYLVAFEAAESDRDGRTHRISVKTNAGNATVRARPAFRIPAALTPAAAGAHLERLLRSPRLSTELPLRLGAYTFRDATSDRLRILVSAETDHAGAGREVTMGFVVIDGKGVIVASGAGATESGRYSLPVAVPPGPYVVRAAALDAGGRQGSVERRVDARLAGAGEVQLSDLMIADPGATPAAPLRPAVARASGDRVVIYFEAYAPAGWTPGDGGVTIDVAGAGASAPALSAPVSLRSAGPGRWAASADLLLRDIKPGPYMATALVSLPGTGPQRIRRAFVVTKPGGNAESR